MRLTRPAHKSHPSLTIVTLLATFVATYAQDANVPLLDLTKPVPREQQETALPGGSSGGVGGQPLPSGYPLPLKIRLISISPTPSGIGEKFTVDVLLQNTGTSPFLMPASQNSIEVFEHEGAGRRNFLFNLIFQDTKNGKQVTFVEAVSAGSETVKKSLLRIDAGKEVRVLFTGDLGPIADWLKGGLDQILIRASASETTFENNRYFIKNQSQPIVSDGAQEISVVR